MAYTIDGLREDMKYALRMASAFSVIAAIPLTLMALVMVYERLAGQSSRGSWGGFGEFVAVTGICYFTTAVASALVLFLARPVRRGRLAWAIGGFVVTTIALAAFSLLFLQFPEASIFMSRGQRSAMDPDTLRWMVRFSPVIGVFAGIIAAFQYSGDRTRAPNGSEAVARPREGGASTQRANTPERRSRAKVSLLKGAIYAALGGYFAAVGIQDLLHQTRSTGLQPGVLTVVSVLMLAFGLWRVKTNVSDLNAP
jgi:hypothetical protein